MKPGAIAMLVGGVLVFISTFLDWVSFGPFGVSAYNGDFFGFTGIILVILSLKVIVGTSLKAFAPQVSLPDDVLGFSMNDLALFAGFAAFIWGFSLVFITGSDIGSFLAALGGIVVVVGAVLEQREEIAEPTRTI